MQTVDKWVVLVVVLYNNARGCDMQMIYIDEAENTLQQQHMQNISTIMFSAPQPDEKDRMMIVMIVLFKQHSRGLQRCLGHSTADGLRPWVGR